MSKTGEKRPLATSSSRKSASCSKLACTHFKGGSLAVGYANQTNCKSKEVKLQAAQECKNA